MNKPESLARAQSARATYRLALQEAIDSGDLHGVNQVLDNDWPQRGWVTAAMMCQAARLPQRDIVRAVATRCDVKVMQTAAKTLCKKHEVQALLGLAEIGEKEVANDLSRWVAATDDVALMGELDRAYRGRSYWARMKNSALTIAAQCEQWEMFRHVIKDVPEADVYYKKRDLLHAMTKSKHVPEDILKSVLDWPVEHEDVGKLHGDLLFYAAQHGRAAHLALLMSGLMNQNGQLVGGSKVCDAIVEAALRNHDHIVALLVPQVDVRDLCAELAQSMAKGSNAWGARQRELKGILDKMGRYLKPDDLATLAQSFPDEMLPITQARLREIRSLDDPGPGGLKRARVRV